MFWLISICIVILLLIVHYIKSAKTSSIRAELEQEYNAKKASLDKSILERESKIKQREKSIAIQEQKLKSVDTRAQWASQVLQEIAERERIVAEKESALSNKELFIREEVNKAIEKKEKSITERERIVAIRSHTLAEKERGIAAIEKDSQYLLSQKWKELDNWERHLNERQSILSTNLTSLPYMARIVADFDTRGLELLARKLDWGSSQEREKKVASIRVLRKETQALLAQYKEAEYQLAYAIKMFPALEEFLETDYSQLPSVDFTDLSAENHDSARSYLSAEEYKSLSSAERNQLALDRYLTSHHRTNWQIGRDYEHYVGYVYTKRGYTVEYYGSLHGLEDLGRDLIATHPDRPTLIIQCKYWSSKKTIHEKHINQLYGTLVCYCFENSLSTDVVKGLLVTNISISDTARKFANYLGIEVVEQFPLKPYPCIKCNINTDESGNKTKIYHLPFDQQYDSCKIDKPGEFFAATVIEAEKAGFRRAFKWYN